MRRRYVDKTPRCWIWVQSVTVESNPGQSDSKAGWKTKRKAEMGEEEDAQRLKRIAAAAYDYDNDPRWADYWSNVLIPPHMASRPDVVDHFKRKFYQRYIVIQLLLSHSLTICNLRQAIY